MFQPSVADHDDMTGSLAQLNALPMGCQDSRFARFDGKDDDAGLAGIDNGFVSVRSLSVSPGSVRAH